MNLNFGYATSINYINLINPNLLLFYVSKANNLQK